MAMENETLKIWKWCQKNGNINTNWTQALQDGTIDDDYIENLASLIDKDYQKRAANAVREVLPDFKLTGAQGQDDDDKSAPVSDDSDQSDIEQKLADLKRALEEEAKRKAASAKVDLPDVPVSKDYIKPDEFDEIAACIRAGMNIFCFGPHGCGKSRLFAEVAKSLDMNFVTLLYGEGTSRIDLLGGTKLTNGSSDYEPSELVKKIQEDNTLIFFDELFSCDPGVSKALNSLLAHNTRVISTPQGEVKASDTVRFCCADNTNGRSFSQKYVGAQVIDHSLLSRFDAIFEMDYNHKAESAILQAIASAHDRAWFKSKLKELRKQVKDNDIQHEVGTRQVLSFVQALGAGLSRARAFTVCFLNRFTQAELLKIKLEVTDDNN